jgi:hypothetical protein
MYKSKITLLKGYMPQEIVSNLHWHNAARERGKEMSRDNNRRVSLHGDDRVSTKAAHLSKTLNAARQRLQGAIFSRHNEK